ncbi:MAG TPA: SBBP repeat-containing protein, partial [Candidatus Acidoferrum sp.]|nr:SBBP repeat-containing protein [Candidatus Acidoferrum sp.]
MSKPIALKGWTCAFYMVPLAVIAAALVVLFLGRTPKAAITVSAGSSASLSQSLTPAAHRRIQDSYASLPLAFEQNQGQTDSQVKYLARGHGYTLFLTANDAVFSLHSRPAASKASGQSPKDPQSLTQRSNTQKDLSSVVHMHLLGANAQARVEGTSTTSGTANYFIGNDPGKWRTGVARYARVSYQNLYPGVNMAFHGSGRELEFDFVLAPGANPAPIGFQFSGNHGVKTDDSGDLIISSAAGNVLLHKPVAYQEQNGARQPVDARFVLKAANQVSFELGNYDRTRELVIDPSVSYAYSTYLGGSGDDNGIAIAFDSNGNAYVTGETTSSNFPGASGALHGSKDAFVAKIAADGSKLIYFTYVGGTQADSGNGIAVDASGDAFVAGGTQSPDFPASPGAFQILPKAGNAGSAFLFKLSPDGTKLLYSTYLGGSVDDVASGVALDSSGNAYLAGLTSSLDFPIPSNLVPLQSASGANDGFIAELNPGGNGASDLKFSTYLGPGGITGAGVKAIALDSSNNIYVTGA